MKTHIIYECEFCGKKSGNLKLIRECEAMHYHLSEEFSEYEKIKDKVNIASYTLSKTHNNETLDNFDNAVKELLKFEINHHINLTNNINFYKREDLYIHYITEYIDHVKKMHKEITKKILEDNMIYNQELFEKYCSEKLKDFLFGNNIVDILSKMVSEDLNLDRETISDLLVRTFLSYIDFDSASSEEAAKEIYYKFFKLAII